MKLAAESLHGRLSAVYDAEPFVVRVTTSRAEAGRADHALLLARCSGDVPQGYGAYFLREPAAGASMVRSGLVYTLPDEISYLDDGDVLRINPRRAEVWVVYRRASQTNSLLLTERCNSWCIMCSQPPKPRDNEGLVRTWLDAIPLMSQDTAQLGFTGGEPTLLGTGFFELVMACKDHLPATALHVLSNGRMFNYLSLARELAAIGHHDLTVGIPLYSDIAWQHDFIVQAQQAFDQTVRGILNLARCGVSTEIRVVIHRHSVDRLPQLAVFLVRNMPFVRHVALMGLAVR